MYDAYAFDVQIWFEEGMWRWSVVQEFNDSEFEPLGYGEAFTPEAASADAAMIVREFFDD